MSVPIPLNCKQASKLKKCKNYRIIFLDRLLVCPGRKGGSILVVVVGIDQVRIHGNRKLASSRAVWVVDLKTHDVVEVVILWMTYSSNF